MPDKSKLLDEARQRFAGAQIRHDNGKSHEALGSLVACVNYLLGWAEVQDEHEELTTTEREAVLSLLRRQRRDEDKGKGYADGSPAQARALVVCDVLDKLIETIVKGEHREARRVAACDMCDEYPATFVAEVNSWYCPTHLREQQEKASGVTKAPMICDGCGCDATFSCLHHVSDKRLCPVCFKKASR